MVVEAPGVVSAARLNGVEARVRLRLLVRADGRVERADVIIPSGRPELDAAAQNAAMGWRFLPARRDGEPIASIALVWVAFTTSP
jgi:protein TonB